jgi:hypothetical protein
MAKSRHDARQRKLNSLLNAVFSFLYKENRRIYIYTPLANKTDIARRACCTVMKPCSEKKGEKRA